MRLFKIVAIAMALVMLIGGSIVSCRWLLIEGTLPIPLASASLAVLGASVLFLELQDHASA